MHQRPLITFTTDFGVSSPYVASMKAAVLKICPAAVIIDLTHTVRPQDIPLGALILQDYIHEFPEGSIHVAVIDPGVGTTRRILCAEIDDHVVIAPDNGLLSPLLADGGQRQVRSVENPSLRSDRVSATFHGRDIMAPLAAHLSCGCKLERVGPIIDDWVQLEWPEPVVDKDRVQGQVLAIDAFGNLITNLRPAMMSSGWHVGCQAVRSVPWAQTYADRPVGQPLALIGSTGRLELSVNGGRADEVFRADIGTPIVLWRENNES